VQIRDHVNRQEFDVADFLKCKKVLLKSDSGGINVCSLRAEACINEIVCKYNSS
jgi:hypothetical protein